MPDWIVLLYYVTAGPVLAALAGVGLWQIFFARRSLDTAREAIELARLDFEQRVESEKTRLAVDMCLRFADHVLPLIDDAYNSLGRTPLPLPREGSDPWELDSYEQKRQFVWRPNDKVRKINAALNAMEAIAIPLTCGAADADLAEDSIGVTFVEAATNFAFVVAAMRSSRRAAFPATRALCDRWSESLSIASTTPAGFRLFAVDDVEA